MSPASRSIFRKGNLHRPVMLYTRGGMYSGSIQPVYDPTPYVLLFILFTMCAGTRQRGTTLVYFGVY